MFTFHDFLCFLFAAYFCNCFSLNRICFGDVGTRFIAFLGQELH
jgi:hypothetical protein